MADGTAAIIKKRLVPLLFRCLAATLRTRSAIPAGTEKDPVIFACLHRDMIPAILYVKSVAPALLISRSDDGEILMNTLVHFGFHFVRGSSGKEGGAAFRGLVQQLARGRHVGIAVDGPRGPFGHIHDGVLRLAQHTGAAIVPLVAAPGRHLALKSWDRTVVPAPFSQITMRRGPEISIGAGEESLSEAEHDLRSYLLGEPSC